MKLLLISIVIAAIAFISCAQNQTKQSATAFQSVSVEKFDSIIADTTGVTLVDVRTPQEFADGHIDRAINIDVKSNDFATIANSTLQKDKTIAIYCRSGRRSKTAAKILTENGFTVVELESGYNGWTSR